MNLGYVIVYVPDVLATVSFYETAFDLKRRFVHESGQYAELETGTMALAFAAYDLAAANLPEGVTASDPAQKPGNKEIVLTTPDVSKAYERAVAAGATGFVAPAQKPWGQTVAYVRDLHGNLIELATPMSEPTAEPQHLLTILAVGDLARSVAFYETVFGWPRRVDTPVYVEFELPGAGLGVYQRQGFAKNTGQEPTAVSKGAITATEIYLRPPDLEAVLQRLQATGARQLSALSPRPWGEEAAYFVDPDGNVVTVARPTDHAGGTQ